MFMYYLKLSKYHLWKYWPAAAVAGLPLALARGVTVSALTGLMHILGGQTAPVSLHQPAEGPGTW